MQAINPGESNVVFADLLNRASVDPIITGTVNFYLIPLSGANEGKWFRTSDNTWQVAESIAGVGSHKADGHWICTIDTVAWVYGIEYLLYAKESGDLHIPYSDQCFSGGKFGVANVDDEVRIYTVTNTVDAQPIQDVEIWVTSDSAGVNILYRDFTNATGQVVFWLPAGTWYYWRRKAGWQFENPDSEVYV